MQRLKLDLCGPPARPTPRPPTIRPAALVAAAGMPAPVLTYAAAAATLPRRNAAHVVTA
jgi:hypothetical protein